LFATFGPQFQFCIKIATGHRCTLYVVLRNIPDTYWSKTHSLKQTTL